MIRERDGMDDTEQKEAEIIRRVYRSHYSHAESVLHRLQHLQRDLSHREAIDVLYHEVVSDPSGSSH